ncbi:hypothetical protein GUJ93_ZPchr0006g42508 [Zizania palustris]|uniref:Ternary complex factor MIP1 leucine-zipper domain-containing protein n=1 Tax=Zizania palustris TaxID=103762 RepID=A0A8J5T0M3_ZIZPA|nr:hypothetical protein GUJ93_ZPchr0006g42508 [Zizania palustris]
MQRIGGGGRRSAGSRGAPQRAERLAPGSGNASASCSGDDSSNGSDKREGSRRVRMQRYRSQLELEVKKLQRQLQEEVDLQLALTDAITHNATLIHEPSTKLPNKAQELIISIASLEITVSKLEKDLNDLCYQLCHLRKDMLLAESNPRCLENLADENNCRCLLSKSLQYQPASTCECSGEEHIPMLRDLKLGESELVQEKLFPGHEDQQDVQNKSEDREMISLDGLLEEHQDVPLNRLLEKRQDEEMQEPYSMENGGKENHILDDALPFDQSYQRKNSMNGNVWNANPNKLSEEMVHCMRDIFLHLSESSSEISQKESSDHSTSSARRLSGCTLTSLSDSSLMPSVMRSPSVDSNHDSIDEVVYFDPYNVNGKVVRRDIGNYCSVAEVSWMYVGKEQLAYASEALRNFRTLVEQLAKVDPTCMNCDERLAFWINLYNALIMHAYLAYGVPENDIKLFSLMQKACYMVGGQSFSAAEIEFVILKMKTPVHRPQLSLMLALHKFRVTEEHKKCSIDDAEPLVLFALSCGMFSSPAVRIFSAGNVRQELQESMRDYIRASVGINDSGKLIVPKLLQNYAKGTVEDSLLADWICRHLTPNQVAAVQDTSSSSQKHRLLGVRSFSVVPFDSKFSVYRKTMVLEIADVAWLQFRSAQQGGRTSTFFHVPETYITGANSTERTDYR